MAGVWQTTNMLVLRGGEGEIYVNFKTCKRPVRLLIALLEPIDGWEGMGVPF